MKALAALLALLSLPVSAYADTDGSPQVEQKHHYATFVGQSKIDGKPCNVRLEWSITNEAQGFLADGMGTIFDLFGHKENSEGNEGYGPTWKHEWMSKDFTSELLFQSHHFKASRPLFRRNLLELKGEVETAILVKGVKLKSKVKLQLHGKNPQEPRDVSLHQEFIVGIVPIAIHDIACKGLTKTGSGPVTSINTSEQQ